MSARTLPRATFAVSADARDDEDDLAPGREDADSDSVDDESSDRAWAEEVAERVVALWVGRGEVVPFASALADARARVKARRRV
jgi:hypothetical protein